jgi:hypothetical protein
VEYAVIAALIALAALGSTTTVGRKVICLPLHAIAAGSPSDLNSSGGMSYDTPRWCDSYTLAPGAGTGVPSR